MKWRGKCGWIVIFGLAMTACGGSLTDEQRKKVREEMEASEIRKVTDADVVDASFSYGRTMMALLEKRDSTFSNQELIDSLEAAFHVQIGPMVPGDSLMHDIENQIIEAYTSGAGQVELSDNVQKLGTDSLLYTKPIVRETAGGNVEFVKAVGIRMPRKAVILSIKN